MEAATKRLRIPEEADCDRGKAATQLLPREADREPEQAEQELSLCVQGVSTDEVLIGLARCAAEEIAVCYQPVVVQDALALLTHEMKTIFYAHIFEPYALFEAGQGAGVSSSINQGPGWMLQAMQVLMGVAHWQECHTRPLLPLLGC